MARRLHAPIELLSVFKLTTRERWDLATPLSILLLSFIGVAFIYSAQYSTDQAVWKQQLVWLSAGAVIYVSVSLIDYRFWLGVSHWFYAAVILLLVAVLIPGVGTEAYGAQRWLNLFGLFSLQPSEPAKAAVLLVAAGILLREKVGGVRESLAVLGKLALAA